MARALRIEYPDAVYHVTSRGNVRNKIFADDQDRENFIAVLGIVVKRYNWFCHAYCKRDCGSFTYSLYYSKQSNVRL